MDYTIVSPKKPSFARLINTIISNRNSITRFLQYEFLKSLNLCGNLLDFGGGERAKYKPLIKNVRYYSINIDHTMEPTWITTAGSIFPCENQYFDTVLSLNTLEHIFDTKKVIDEIFRVLKKDGEFLCTVPFLYPIHAHPDDYFRPTPSWWRDTLTSAGFSKLEIIPLVWGPFTTGLTCSGVPGPLKRPRIILAAMLDILYSKFQRPQLINHSLSFFIVAKK